MSYTLKGRLIEIFDAQQVSEKFTKRSFVVETQDGQYSEQIKLELVNAKVNLIDPFVVGQEVEVSFNLRGKGFNKNGQIIYFTNLDAWKLQALGAAPAPQAAPISDDITNDLPF